MTKSPKLFNKLGVAAVVGALALTVVSPVKADPILGQFEITPGTLNAKLIGLSAFNTAYTAGTPSYTYAGFTSYGNTVASAINMRTDSVSPTNTVRGSEGTTDPQASTSSQTVRGVFTAAWLNGAGTSFNSTLNFTNFAKATAIGTIITPEVVLPIYDTASHASLQARDVEASNVAGYTGQGVTGIGAQLGDTASPVTSVTNATSTGVSQTYTLLDFNTGNGLGEYYKNTGLNFTIPAFAQTGKYVSTLTFTNTVE